MTYHRAVNDNCRCCRCRISILIEPELNRRMSITPKALHQIAQGREAWRAHPGRRKMRFCTPTGYHKLPRHRFFLMPQSFAQIYLHLVFSTKDRRPFLQDSDVQSELHAYLGGICRDVDCPSFIVGGVADHVHILCHLGRTITVADLVRELKRESSKWLKERFPQQAEFHWQSGYGAFSISPSHVPAVKEYIRTQEEHHRTVTFQDELRTLLTKYGVQWDERYVWD